jgi:hypothetical protein
MFDIHERLFYQDIDTETPQYMKDDFTDSCARHQVKRVFHRPLVTKKSSHKTFTSWKGRSVCIVRFCHNLVREPFRYLKNIVVIIIVSWNAFLSLLNAPFCKSARAQLGGFIFAPLEMTAGLLIRPLGYFIDMFQLASGALLHPSIAIH